MEMDIRSNHRPMKSFSYLYPNSHFWRYPRNRFLIDQHDVQPCPKVAPYTAPFIFYISLDNGVNSGFTNAKNNSWNWAIGLHIKSIAAWYSLYPACSQLLAVIEQDKKCFWRSRRLLGIEDIEEVIRTWEFKDTYRTFYFLLQICLNRWNLINYRPSVFFYRLKAIFIRFQLLICIRFLLLCSSTRMHQLLVCATFFT